MDILRIVLAILLPPLAVFLTVGLGCISGSISSSPSWDLSRA
jgi:uncharacterized membrane protein YqaE (UPF0057 family)